MHNYAKTQRPIIQYLNTMRFSRFPLLRILRPRGFEMFVQNITIRFVSLKSIAVTLKKTTMEKIV